MASSKGPLAAAVWTWGRYLLTGTAVGAALALRLAATPALGPGYAFIVFYPVVLLIAVYLGMGPGVAAVALSALASAYWLLEPTGSLAVGHLSDRVALATFVVLAGVMVLLAHRLRRATEAAQRSAAELREEVKKRAAVEELLRGLNTELGATTTKFRALFDMTADAILLADDGGRYLEANPAACRLTGYARGELLSMTVAELAGAPSDEAVEALWREFLRSGQQAGEFVLRRRDGSGVEVDYTAVANVLPGVHMSALRDVSERKRSVALVKEQARELARSNAELRDYAHAVAHDLREPLRNMRLLARFAREDGPVAGAGRLEDIEKQAARMDGIIEALLRYAEASHAPLSSAPVDPGEVAREVVGAVRERLAKENARVEIAPDLPMVACDRTQLGQVFANLVGNAVRYNRSARKMVEIGWRPGEAGGVAAPVLYVSDNGIGIEAGEEERVFEVFRRLRGAAEFGEGTGIGLPIVRRIVERHGGRIWVESKPGEGSTFLFTLGGREAAGRV